MGLLSLPFNNICLILGDVLHTPFRNGIINKITCFDLLEHLHHPSNAIFEILSLCKQDSLIIIGTHNKWTINKFILNIYSKCHRKFDSTWNIRHVSLIDVNYFNKNFSNYLSLRYLIVYGHIKRMLYLWIFTIASIFVNLFFNPIKAKQILLIMNNRLKKITNKFYIFTEFKNLKNLQKFFGFHYLIFLFNKK